MLTNQINNQQKSKSAIPVERKCIYPIVAQHPAVKPSVGILTVFHPFFFFFLYMLSVFQVIANSQSSSRWWSHGLNWVLSG